MSTAIEELYNEKQTDYGRLNTPDLRLFTEQETNKHEISCVDILEHIQNCPVCSKLYTYNNPNSERTDQIRENYKNTKDTETKNNNYIVIGLVLLFVFLIIVIVAFFLMRNDRKNRKLFPLHSPYRSK